MSEDCNKLAGFRVEFLINLPVVPSNSTTYQSVELAGQITAPSKFTCITYQLAHTVAWSQEAVPSTAHIIESHTSTFIQDAHPIFQATETLYKCHVSAAG